MKIKGARRTDITELAETVFEIHSKDSGIAKPSAILRAKRISLHCETYPESFDALIACCSGKFHVHLNLRRVGDLNSSRARFALCHELGHFFIDEHRSALLAGEKSHASSCGMFDGAGSIEELEADHFAANLLMPPSRFVPGARDKGSPLRTILALHTEFKASLTATALQYVQHVSDRAIVLRWDTHGALAWTTPGRGYRAAGYRSTRFKRPSELPPDSATGRVLSGQVAHDSGVLTMATVFLNVAEAENRNLIVREEAISLGKYGVLTIISDNIADKKVSSRAARRRERNKS